jgi:putative oxidoreductase
VSDAAGAVLLVGRILFAAYFAYYGLGHLRGSRGFVEGTRARGRLPMPFLAGWPAGVWLWAGALSVALGVWPDVGALMLGVFVTLTILVVHDFWNLDEDAGREAQRQLFLRNTAFVASCVALFAAFTGLGQGLPLVLVHPLLSL